MTMTQDNYLGQDQAALSSSEGLDEDELRVDPLEKGVEPPEHWTAADKYGTTAQEQLEGEPHEQRFAAEEPDVQPVPVEDTSLTYEGPTHRSASEDMSDQERRGQSADGG
jgi:hypothetical protein